MCIADSPRKTTLSKGEKGEFGARRSRDGASRNRHRGKGKRDQRRNVEESEGLQELKKSLRRCHSFSEVSSYLLTGTLLSVFFVAITPYLPYLTSPQAADDTFHFASYDYEVDLSHFDNTAWTYATDYGLAAVMGLLIWSFPSTKTVKKETSNESGGTSTRTISHSHTWRSQGMLLCYLVSVLSGGLAHHFYTTLESRSTLSFRVLWTLCVGTVTLAPAFMGSIATELHHLDRETSSETEGDKQDELVRTIPIVPCWFWVGYAICSTWVATNGGMSYQRPACDICVAGVTQTPCTMYLIAMICYGFRKHNIPQWTRFLTPVAYLLNAPLFPLYPILIQYTDWSLASVNTLLHAWLLVSWTTQGIILRRVAIALDEKRH